MVQGRLSNAALRKNETLALARKARLVARAPTTAATPHPNDVDNQDADNESSGDEIECTGWSGGVTHYISSDEEPIFISDSDEEEEEVEDLSWSEVEEGAQQHREELGGAAAAEQPTAEIAEEPSAMVKQPMAEPNSLSVIMGLRTNQEWKEAESTRSLGYNGQSDRTKRHRAKVARDKEVNDARLRKG